MGLARWQEWRLMGDALLENRVVRRKNAPDAAQMAEIESVQALLLVAVRAARGGRWRKEGRGRGAHGAPRAHVCHGPMSHPGACAACGPPRALARRAASSCCQTRTALW